MAPDGLPGDHWAGGDHTPAPGAQSFMEQQSGGGGGGIWSSLDASRAVIILFSSAAKSPSELSRLFVRATRQCGSEMRDIKTLIGPNWVLDPSLADPNTCFEQSAPR